MEFKRHTLVEQLNDNKIKQIHDNSEKFDIKTEESFKYLQIFRNICKYLQISANIYKHL